MKDPIVFKVYRGEHLVLIKQFVSPQVIIGRQSESGLTLDDESISPLHAVLEERNGNYYLSDMGSSSGVTMGGVKILESKIDSGEAFIIGPYSVRFYVGVPTPPVPINYEKSHKVPARETYPKEVSQHEPVIEEEHLSFGDESEVDDKTQPFGTFNELDDEVTDSGVPPLKTQPSKEPKQPKVEVEKKIEVPKADPPPVHIERRDVEEVLSRQKVEPISSGYMAPSSEHSAVEDVINLYSRGPVLEIILSWQERIIETHHFSNSKSIYISNKDDGSVFIPLLGNEFKHKIVSLNDGCVVHLADSMTGTLYENGKDIDLTDTVGHPAFSRSGSLSQLKFEQGQTLKINFLNDKISLFIRYVEDTPVAKAAPVFDFTSSEIIGIFMSVASVVTMALYMLFYVSEKLPDTDKLLEDRLKKAVITFKPPPRVEKPKPPKKIVKKVTVKPKKKVVKVAEKKSKPKPKKKPQKKKLVKIGEKKKKQGKPKAAAPSRVKTKNKVGSSRPGGSVKTGKKAANQASKKKDLTKTGILGILGGGGKSTSIDKTYSGVGATIGTADSKTGFQGQLSEQTGEGLGTKLKAGKGGSGSSLAGVGDIKTSGRSGGSGGYGTADLGGKGSTTILNLDGEGGDFSSTIDKEAIRRLIRKNKRSLRSCYERELSSDSTLSGRIVLSWKIAGGGKMISPKVVKNTLGNKAVANCIKRRLMGLTFPSPGPNEIAEVESFPFVFESK